jgi:pimeloyl-ACP methyl ester carboxylesterase
MDVLPTQRPNGRTVVLLHGKNFSGAYWEPTIRVLVGEGFRVVVPDQIGFGKSTKPEAFQFTFQVLATTTRALLDSLHIDRATVVGHSMRGMLAIRFALMFPERVERLALVNPIGLEDWKTLVPYRTIDENYAEELAATADTIRNYQRTSYSAGHWELAYEKHRAPGRMDASSGVLARRVVCRTDVGHDLHSARRIRIPSDSRTNAADHRSARPYCHRPRLGSKGRRLNVGQLSRVGPQRRQPQYRVPSLLRLRVSATCPKSRHLNVIEMLSSNSSADGAASSPSGSPAPLNPVTSRRSKERGSVSDRAHRPSRTSKVRNHRHATDTDPPSLTGCPKIRASALLLRWRSLPSCCGSPGQWSTAQVERGETGCLAGLQGHPARHKDLEALLQ